MTMVNDKDFISKIKPFSLIKILVGVAIIGILIVAIIVTYNLQQKEKHKIDAKPEPIKAQQQPSNNVWLKTIRSEDDDHDYYAYSIQQTSDGGYIVAGEIYNFYGASMGGLLTSHFSTYILIIKLDSSGNIRWTKKIEDPYLNSIYLHYFQQTPDGGYIFVGENRFFRSPYGDILIAKLDSSGSILWTKIIESSIENYYISSDYFIHPTSDEGYIVVVNVQLSGKKDEDILIIKLDSSGNILW